MKIGSFAHFTHNLTNQLGLSLVEIITAMGIFSVIALGTAQIVMLSASHLAEETKEDLDLKGSVIAGEKTIYAMLSKSSDSFDFLIVTPTSCTGGCGANVSFFEQTEANNAREMQFILTPSSRPFYILVANDDKQPSFIYDPLAAYTVGESSQTETAPLTFQGLNYRNFVSSQTTNLWKEGQMLLLTTAAQFKSTNNDQKAGRPLTFLGLVSGNNLERVSSGTEFRFHTNHPVDNSEIDSADLFLRKLPPIGGVAALVQLRPVSFFKFKIETAAQGIRSLVGYSFDNNSSPFSNGKRIEIMSKVECVIFKRPDRRTKEILFSIVPQSPESFGDPGFMNPLCK